MSRHEIVKGPEVFVKYSWQNDGPAFLKNNNTYNEDVPLEQYLKRASKNERDELLLRIMNAFISPR